MTARDLRCALIVRLRGLPHRGADRRLESRIAHDPAAPPLILSPHCDDAVLNCWSVLERGAAVVNLFAGVPPQGTLTSWDRVCGGTDSAALVRERIAEDRAALATVGVDPVNLPFLDQQYRGCHPGPAFAEIDAQIAGAVPAASVGDAPLGLRHSDHRFARRYAGAIARAGVPVRIYADIPYVSELGWPDWVTGEPAHPRLDVAARFEEFAAAAPEIGAARDGEVVRLEPDRADAKLAAIQRYESQFPALDQGPLHAISNPAIHGFELFWPLKRR
jgi:LmbE family N-acetylglucosaminyl deacetylase